MKRYYQSISKSGNVTGEKKRRIFQPLQEITRENPLAATISTAVVNNESKEDEEQEEVVESYFQQEKIEIFKKSEPFKSEKQDQEEEIIPPLPLSTTATPIFILPQSDRIQARNCPIGNWMIQKNLMVKLSSEIENNTRIGVIAFDLDGTLITTKSGKVFAKGKTDWKFFDSIAVKSKLESAYTSGYSLVIISNQQGAMDDKEKQKDLREKIDTILDSLKPIPFDFICAFDDDYYRKPRTGVWEYLYEARFRHFSTPVTSENCTYVGDAAGRPAYGMSKKDFADTDYKFALNLNIQFATPQKYFLNSQQRVELNLPMPSSGRLSDYLPPSSSSILSSNPFGYIESLVRTPSSNPEIVLLVAAPASGKSTIARHFQSLVGYQRINQDELGSINRCLTEAKVALKKGLSVVIDNTNLNPSVRKTWIDVAKEFNIKIRCIVLQTPKEVCMLLSAFRLVDPLTVPEDKRKISSIVIHKFFKDQVLPKVQDGFDRVDVVDWVPQRPSNDHPITSRLFNMFLK